MPVQDVTRLLAALGKGDANAVNDLIPLVYAELRRLAGYYMQGERAGHTLQATALVHEAYLRLVDQTQIEIQNRTHFFALAAQQMRRILVDQARARHAAKRDGGELLPLNEIVVGPENQDVDMVALDDALEALTRLDPQQGKIVELRYFGGLTIEETAVALGISPATVKRDWNLARAWLFQQMQRGG